LGDVEGRYTRQRYKDVQQPPKNTSGGESETRVCRKCGSNEIYEFPEYEQATKWIHT
jgi:hypothetical protein